MNRLVSTLLRTDGPGASWFARRSFARVVFAFAVRVADGMNRREVDDVDADLADFVKHTFAVLECAARSPKHFIPGAEASANRIDRDTQLPMVRRVSTVRVPGGENCEPIVNRFNLQSACRMQQFVCIGAHRALARRFQKLCADLQIDGNFLIRSNSFQEVLVPSLEGITPRTNSVDIIREVIDR